MGFTALEQIKKAITTEKHGQAPQKRLLQQEDLDTMKRIEEKAQDIDSLFALFRQQQTELGGEVTTADKQELRKRLKALEDELNRYLASEYGISQNHFKSKPPYEKKFSEWLASHKPFHWFIEFHAIMKNGGFDVIIGNPPYVKYSKVKDDYTIKGYKTENCGNLYAFVMERSLSLIRKQGRCGLIIPIASVSTNGMSELQQLYDDYIQWHSHYATRPGKLFMGVDMNLTISLLTHFDKHKHCTSYSTFYYRWSNGTITDRDSLFQRLQYIELPSNVKLANKYPKLGSSVELKIIRQMLSKGQKIENYYDRNGKILYYHSGGRYWRKALPQKLSSHYKPVTISEKTFEACFCLLNSQLFYWYWIINSNCMDVVEREVFKLPVFNLTDVNSEDFYKLMNGLLSQYSTSTTIRPRRGEIINTDEINFDVQKSKPIIDEIDRVLARHYGFTDDELDYIINYDIKYRMGRVALENDESS